MKYTFFLVPISSKAGITAVSLGLVRALDKRGLRVGFCKPIGQLMVGDNGPDRSTHFIRATTSLKPATPISLDRAENMVAEGRIDELMSIVMHEFHESARDADIMIMEGLVPVADDSYIGKLNMELIRTLSAEVILVGNAAEGLTQTLREQLDLGARRFASGDQDRVAGCILNRVHTRGDDVPKSLGAARTAYEALSETMPPLVGLVPENEALTHCRTIDIARHLNAEVINGGEMDHRRVKEIHLLARTVPNMMHVFRPGNILVSPADRDDVLLATCMAALNQIPIAGLVLTGDTVLDERIYKLCEPGIRSGLPVLRVQTNSYETASQLNAMSTEVPADDLQRISEATEFVSEYIDAGWIEERCKRDLETRLSPAAFCFQLTERARAVNKRIILPEGSEPRTIRAAAICAERKIARCVLLGDPGEIRRVAAANEVQLPTGVEIIDAGAVRGNYVDALVERRKHKNLSRKLAEGQLEDDVVLGTMMLALGEVDGLVSGAVHSSASTVRPALQLIKTKPDVKSVSSVFFMCLPDQVLVYGDCAVIQDPDAPTLAEIALQSAESALMFGIPARVAMISYSTGESGSGADVEKVREATRIAKEQRPDLLIDGPLQYDAAAIADVAEKKAPDSPVAGRATVYVFPDLNTGNTTYKAVQRSANLISIGPMLQGLRRPVNDLSRGALVEDIVYTIALTAVQAAQG
jgi:phosphate acetyltransferase